MQVFWILVGLGIFSLVWRRGDQALLGGGQLMRTCASRWLFLKVGVLNELQYRVNFVVSCSSRCSRSSTGLVVLALVYSHTTSSTAGSQAELLVVLGIQILMGGVIRAFIQPNMMRFIEDVREGTLDYALTKPEDAQVLVSVRSSGSGRPWTSSWARS